VQEQNQNPRLPNVLLLFFTNVENFSPRTIIKTKANNRKTKTKDSPHFHSIFPTNKQILNFQKQTGKKKISQNIKTQNPKHQ
jgi:hypothetical protein